MGTIAEPGPGPARITPDREPSGHFVTVGAQGRLYPLPDPDRVLEIGSLGDLERRADAWGNRWRMVWLTPAAVKWLDLPARRKGPIELAGLKIRAAQWEAGSPFAGIEDALELYRQLWRLEAALGVGWFTSAAVTSDVLLRALHRPPRARAIAPTVLPAVAIKSPRGRRPPGGEAPLMWHRAPHGRDRGDWVHHYDLNGAYLAAASKLRLPQGAPLELDGTLEDPRRHPGYWRIEADPWTIETMPEPWRKPDKRDPELWVTTPTLRILSEIDWPHRITAGWYWTDTCEALTPWYERLRDARAQLDGPALDAVKMIYRWGIGRLGSPERTNLEDPLYQPAWAHHVIAESRARIWRRLANLPRHPLAIETDACWIQHESADPLEAAEELGLPIGPRLGQWKPLGRLPAIEAAAILTGPPRGVFRALKEAEHGI